MSLPCRPTLNSGRIAQARRMRLWAHKKGGSQAHPDGFDRADPFTLASLIDHWFRRLQERHYSPKSIQANQWDLRSFLAWAQQRDLTRPEHITKPILESYQRWLYRYRKKDGTPLGAVSQRRRMLALQRFFAWLCRDNLLKANPASDLELPRKPMRLLPKALNHQQVAAVMALPDVSDALGIRDRAILETFYSTGIRRSELVGLDLADLDIQRRLLMIRQGKGGKDRVSPLGRRALYWLEAYLQKTRPQLEVSLGEAALFLTGYGTRFSPAYLGNWVSKLIAQSGIGPKGSCHLLRHTCATHMLEGGADIRYIQQLLGHSKLDTTAIYTEVSITQLQAVHARCHPAGK